MTPRLTHAEKAAKIKSDLEEAGYQPALAAALEEHRCRYCGFKANSKEELIRHDGEHWLFHLMETHPPKYTVT